MTIATIRVSAALVALLGTASAVSAQSGMTSEQVQRRYQVRVMEGVLVGAAHHGAELLAIKVQQIDPSIVLTSGNPPRALGLVLDGHGIVFYIEIPGINPAIAWSLRNRSRDQVAEAALLAWKRHLQELPANDQSRADLELHTRRIEQRLLPPGAASQPRQGAMPINGTAPPANSFAPVPRMDDPEAEYERLVTQQLVNAMLDYSHQLGLGADEWLTVAARGSQGPLETVHDALVTITLRIKGSDLADLRGGRITRDEARARIVVREF